MYIETQLSKVFTYFGPKMTAIFIDGSNICEECIVFFHQDGCLFQSQPPEVKSLNTLSPAIEKARSLQMMEFGSFFILTFVTNFVSNRVCKTSDQHCFRHHRHRFSYKFSNTYNLGSKYIITSCQ